MKKFYITTPIYYASGNLTLGHCYSSLLADVVARFYRLNNHDVFFLTGSDEHGLKISRKAEEAGMEVKDFVDSRVEHFKEVFSKLGISYDKFIRTTDAEHKALVEKVYIKLLEKGDIYLSKYEGLYCVPCETFFAESNLVDGNCPDCNRPVEMFSEESYFLKLSKYQQFLEEHFEKNKDFLTPLNRKNEMFKNFIKPGVTDLCVSRTNFDWGIKLPFDKKHVAYVWIDALLNYVSALGYGSDKDELYKKYWPCDVHIVGRDIARFHAIIWPIVLHILDIPLPKKIHSTGFITQKGERVSKSQNAGFDPLFLINRYGVDAVRYHLVKTGPLNYDSPYTLEAFITNINSDLCNDLGNLVSRTCAMVEKYFNSIVPTPVIFNDDDKVLIDGVNALYKNFIKDFEKLDINTAIDRVINIVKCANKYIDVTTPWLLSKNNDERLKTVLYVLIETLRNIGIALKPFLIEVPSKIFAKIGIEKEDFKVSDIQFENANVGGKVEKGNALYERLDIKEELKMFDDNKCGTNEIEDGKNNINISTDKTNDNKCRLEASKTDADTSENAVISFDDFLKVELKIGTIINSENVEGSDKLLKNTVKIGNEERTIVSGIAKTYSPQDVIGKQVVVVTNLASRKIKGILSEGMILCASNGDSLSLICPLTNIEDGSEVN